MHDKDLDFVEKVGDYIEDSGGKCPLGFAHELQRIAKRGRKPRGLWKRFRNILNRKAN